MKLIIRKFYIMELGQVEILYYVRFNCSYKYFRHRVEYLRKKQERTTQIHARICSGEN